MKPILQEVLGVRPEQVHLSSLLIADLGAESIDLLDLSFQILDLCLPRLDTRPLRAATVALTPKCPLGNESATA